MAAEIILASQSPRRRELLAKIAPVFTVEVSDTEELKAAESPAELVRQNALAKAIAVAKNHPEAVVIGADTVVALGNSMMGKPRDLEEAFAMLRKLAGRTHSVFTGVAVLGKGREVSYCEESRVTFKALNDSEIRAYLQLVNVLDKAGAYALQEHGEMLAESVTGEPENVIGLPLKRLKAELAALL